MPPHPDTLATDSRLKKRERDRRAQQNVRNKRAAHVSALELRISDLENELRNSRDTCDGLRQEIDLLRGRQGFLQQLVASWGDGTDGPGGLPSPYPTVAPSSAGMTSRSSLPSTPATAHQYHPTRDDRREAAGDTRLMGEVESATVTTPAATLAPDYVAPPRWHMLPAHIPERDIVVTNCFSKWIERPDLVCACPESPHPVELLYGSKRNFLANIICETMQQWPCREPERMACGWMTYQIIKWMVQPSERRFADLYDFMHPTQEQLCQPHPYYADFFIWPTLRANLIKHLGAYNDIDVVGMMSCCIKVRWPWNTPFLEPNEDNQLVLKPEFCDTFMSLEGWGLTKEFFDKFPLLVEGLDSSVLYELC